MMNPVSADSFYAKRYVRINVSYTHRAYCHSKLLQYTPTVHKTTRFMSQLCHISRILLHFFYNVTFHRFRVTFFLLPLVQT